MKRIGFSMLAMLGMLGWVAAAGAEEFHVVMVQPMALASNTLSLEYEVPLAGHFGLGMRLNALANWEIKGGMNSNPGDEWDYIYKFNGAGFGLSGRFYPGGQAPKGFYLGPRLDYVSAQGTYEDKANNQAPVASTLTVTIAHLEIGYKWLIKDVFALGLFADGGYGNVKSDGKDSLASIFAIIGGGVYLGWAF